MPVYLPPSPFQVGGTGYVSRKPYHSARGSLEYTFAIRYFIRGSGIYRDGPIDLSIEPGMVGLFPPGDSGMLMADPDDPYEFHFCHYLGAHAEALSLAILEDRKSKLFPIAAPWRILELFREIGECTNPAIRTWLGKREGCLAHILALLHPNRRNRESTSLSPATLEHYLRRNISEPTNLSQIATDFGVSRTSLCRTVKQMTGKTVLQIHESLKMEQAGLLLRAGRLNVSETAIRVGYANAFYFSRVFKKHYKQSPKRWAQAGNSDAR